jgi:hypothetical protein
LQGCYPSPEMSLLSLLSVSFAVGALSKCPFASLELYPLLNLSPPFPWRRPVCPSKSALEAWLHQQMLKAEWTCARRKEGPKPGLCGPTKSEPLGLSGRGGEECQLLLSPR